MVLTTIAGDVNYKITFSVSKTGAAGSETPDGNAIHFLCEKFKLPDRNNDSRKVSANHTVTQYSTNKLDTMLKLINVVVLPQSGTTATTELDVIRNYLYTYGSKTGAAKTYAWVYHIAEAQYVKLSWDSSHTQKRYLYGKPQLAEWEGGKGKFYTTSSVAFGEVTI